MSGIRDILGQFAHMGQRCVYCRREIPESVQICLDCAAAERGLLADDSRADGILHVFRYEGVVQKLVRNLKYNDMPRLSIFMAQKMADLCRQHGITVDIITYVPVHKKRRAQRGFDQCELIAAQLSMLLELPFTTLLERTRDTQPQYGLGREQRAQNTKDAFRRVGDMPLAGKRVFLIDDVYTTGATMQACIHCLPPDAHVLPFAFSREY